MVGENSGPGWIFCSTDLGESWTEITPRRASPFFRAPNGVRLLVADNTLLTQGIDWFRSTDAGHTWTQFRIDKRLAQGVGLQDPVVNERVFYTIGTLGIYRTTDAGKSWHTFMNGIVGTKIKSLIASNNRLYVHTGRDILQSTDSGESWNASLLIS